MEDGLKRGTSSAIRVARPIWNAIAVAALVVVLGSGCAAASTGSTLSGEGLRTSSLERCVTIWNRAPLGTGRALARSASLASMVVFSNQTCGFAFRSPGTDNLGGPGVFLTSLYGDHAVTLDPVTGPASTILSHTSALQRLADRDVNVRVDQRTGDQTVIRGTRIKKSPYTVTVARAPCATVTPLYPATPLLWQVVTQVDVNSFWVKTVIWAWSAHEGKLIKGSPGAPGAKRRIVNWICTGSDPQRVGQETVMTDLRCVSGPQTFHAQGRAPGFVP